jgi:hypothetical protein
MQRPGVILLKLLSNKKPIIGKKNLESLEKGLQLRAVCVI